MARTAGNAGCRCSAHVADHAVFQHLPEEGARRIAAGEVMAQHQFDEPLGQHAGASPLGLVAEIFRQGDLRHQPALLGGEGRRHARACPMGHDQRSRLLADTRAERRMSQDLVRRDGSRCPARLIAHAQDAEDRFATHGWSRQGRDSSGSQIPHTRTLPARHLAVLTAGWLLSEIFLIFGHQ